MRFPPPGAQPRPQPHETKTPCRAPCCKTPFGHSTVRDQFPSWHREACRCHGEES